VQWYNNLNNDDLGVIMNLFDILLSMNNWWKNERIDVPFTKRDSFENVMSLMNENKFMICIRGLRRVGKTTLIRQIISELIDDGINPENILYISLDDPRLLNYEYPILESYELWKERFGIKKGYLFVDEIHFSKNFDLQLKRIWDENKPNVIFTGSIALFLKKGIADSLAGRVVTKEINPLSFKEFLDFKGIEHVNFSSCDEIILGGFRVSDSIYSSFYEYMTTGGFPDTIDMDKDILKNYLRETYVDRVLLKDIPAIFGNVDNNKLMRTFSLLAESSGNKINFSRLSNDLGIKIDTLQRYSDYIEATGLIHYVYRISKSIRASKKIFPKVYLPTTSLIEAFGKMNVKEGALVESAVENFLEGEKFYWEGKKEVDFIVDRTAIEVKFSNNPESALMSLIELKKYFDYEKAIVVTKRKIKVEKIQDSKIYFIPAPVFLLTDNENI
jgi:hypothetical protein